MISDLSGPDSPPSCFHFADFILDPADRQLWRGSSRVDLKPRYFDALHALTSSEGRLVSKDELFNDVWGDVVVSDSALTQCIKEIRKELGDDASNPRFIQTVTGHGYRFIAPVERAPFKQTTQPTESVTAAPPPPSLTPSPAMRIWLACTLGGALAGVFGGLLYGFGLSSPEEGVGTLSTLMVLLVLNLLVGVAGGLGVGAGFAGGVWLAARQSAVSPLMTILFAAVGGLVVGAAANMLGLDAFNLLLGEAPAGITGGMEGALLGGLVAVGAVLGPRMHRSPWSSAWSAALGGAVAGALIPLLGGRLMGGSLKIMGESFSESRLDMTAFGSLFGDLEMGVATEMVLTGIEGAIFGGCLVGAMIWSRRFGK